MLNYINQFTKSLTINSDPNYIFGEIIGGLSPAGILAVAPPLLTSGAMCERNAEEEEFSLFKTYWKMSKLEIIRARLKYQFVMFLDKPNVVDHGLVHHAI